MRRRDIEPQVVTYAIAVTMTFAAGLLTGGVVLVALAAFGLSAVVGDVVGWCDPAAMQSGPRWWIAVPAVTVLVWLAALVVVRIWRYLHRPRPCGHGPILVIQTETPQAYSVPGRPGQVVVSQSMLDCLSGAERRALLAHERSHLRHGHHRYLLLADLAAASPPVRPLARLLRFYLERWADEDAALHVGDRKVVAKAIARAAVATTRPPPFATLALSSVGVPERVEALLAGHIEGPSNRSAQTRARMAALGVGGSTGIIGGLLAGLFELCT